MLVSYNLGSAIITCPCSLLVEIGLASFNVSSLPSDMSSCNDKNSERGHRERKMSLKSYVRNAEINCFNVAKKVIFANLYVCVLSLDLSQSSTILFIHLESASHTKSNYRTIMLLITGLDLDLSVL